MGCLQPQPADCGSGVSVRPFLGIFKAYQPSFKEISEDGSESLPLSWEFHFLTQVSELQIL